MSWTATPVRSATVISPSEARLDRGVLDDAAQLDQALPYDRAGAHGPVDLAPELRLAQAVDDDPVRPGQEDRIELLFRGGVGAHRGDVRPRPDPAGLQERRRRRRAGDDEVRRRGDLFGPERRPDLEAGRSHVPPVGFELVVVDAPDDRPVEPPDAPEPLELHPALDAGAEDPDRLHLLRRQVLGDDGPGNGRPQVGQVTLVEEDGLEGTRLLAEDEHQSVARR